MCLLAAGRSSCCANKMGTAIDSFLSSKAATNHRKAYVTSLRQYLQLFARGREGMGVSEFTTQHIEDWFAGRAESPSSRASNLGRLSSFFEYCCRRGWIENNPCCRVERVRILRKAPQILNPEQVKLLLGAADLIHPRLLLWMVLAVFVGVRRDELARLSLETIKKDAAHGILVIDATAAKMRRRRVIQLQPQARAWIDHALSRSAELPLAKIYVRRRIRQMRKWLALKSWPQDILRHTALSYQLAECRDASAVALDAGNSPAILLTHYNGLVTPEQLRAWKELMPNENCR